MSKLTERRDSLIQECESIKAQHKEATASRQKAENLCIELVAQFNDKQSRINELNSFIEEEEGNDVDNSEACPA